MGKLLQIIRFVLIAAFAVGGFAMAGSADIEAKIIMLSRADDGGMSFAVRENNKLKVKVKNNGPDEVAFAMQVKVFPGRAEAQGEPIYKKIVKVDRIAADQIMDVAFDGINVKKEGHYFIKAVIVPINDHVDTTDDNNEITRRPSRARKFTPRKK